MRRHARTMTGTRVACLDATMKQLKIWKQVNQVFDGYAAHLKGTAGLQAV